VEETLVEPTEDGAASRLLKPLAKGTTGLYSGYLLATYCPPKTPADELHTGTLWLIYGLIAMTSPIGLWLGRHWVRRGLHHR